MIASSGANTRGDKVSAPGPTTSPEEVEAHRDDCQRNDRLARLKWEERGIVDHDVDIGGDSHDAHDHHNRRPYEEANPENDPKPPGFRQTPKPLFCNKLDGNVADFSCEEDFPKVIRKCLRSRWFRETELSPARGRGTLGTSSQPPVLTG